MIYTIGQRDLYDQALERSPTVFKLGRQGDYPGGSVFATHEAAALYLADEGLPEFAVYGVDAEWGIDTEPSQDGPWHDLLRDAKLMRVGEEPPVNHRAPTFRSNCILQAMLAWLRAPGSIRIHRRGPFLAVLAGGMPHFYWHDRRDGNHYHFTAEDLHLPLWRTLWFEGHIDTFPWHGKAGRRETIG